MRLLSALALCLAPPPSPPPSPPPQRTPPPPQRPQSIAERPDETPSRSDPPSPSAQSASAQSAESAQSAQSAQSESAAPPAAPPQQAPPSPSPPPSEPCDFPLVTVRRLPAGRPRDCYMLLSADVYLLPADAPPPRCALAFAGADRLRLCRLPDGAALADLDAAVRPVEKEGCAGADGAAGAGTGGGDGGGGGANAEATPCGIEFACEARDGAALRGERSARYEITAQSRRLRDDWLGVLRMRMAPWTMISVEVLAALCPAAAPPPAAPLEDGRSGSDGQLSPLLSALSEAFPSRSVGSLVTDESVDDAALEDALLGSPVSPVAGGEPAPRRPDRAFLWTAEKVEYAANATARTGAWLGAFTSGAAAIADTADSLARPLGGIALIGPIIGVVAVVAHASDTVCRMHANKALLADARRQLQYISFRLCDAVVKCSKFGMDDRLLIERMFTVIEDCWDLMAEIERLLLDRVWGRYAGVLRTETLMQDIGSLKLRVESLEDRGFSYALDQRLNAVEAQMSLLDVSEVVASPATHRVVSIPALPAHFSVEAVRLRQQLLAAIEGGGTEERPVVRVAVRGAGGSGKTVALKCAAHHFAHSSDHFGDGVVWLDLGPDATPQSVCSELLGVCELFEPDWKSHELEKWVEKDRSLNSMGAVSTAVQIARETLETRKVLLVVDGGWIRPSSLNSWSSGGGLQWAECLSDVLSFPGSCFLFSSRFDRLCESADSTVHIGSFDLKCEGDEAAAAALFDSYCECDRYKGEYDAVVRDEIIAKFTLGLPIAIANAGVFVRRKRWRFQDALSDLKEEPKEIFNLTTTAGSLSRFLNLCLRDLDMHPSSSATFLSRSEVTRLRQIFGGSDRCFSILYAHLCVLPKRMPRAPTEILACLWGVDAALARKISLLLESCELLTVEQCSFVSLESGEDTSLRTRSKMIALHDLQYTHADQLLDHLVSAELCIHGCPLTRSALHAKLISGYCKAHLNQDLSPGIDWSPVLNSASSDSTRPHEIYVRDNLVRHLEGAVTQMSDDDAIRSCLAELQNQQAVESNRIRQIERVRELEDMMMNLDLEAQMLRDALDMEEAARSDAVGGPASRSMDGMDLSLDPMDV